MPDEARQLTAVEWSRKAAVDLFNLAWELMDRTERSAEDDDQMVHAAHASRFHWGEVGEPVNLQRGEWQVSRVYAVLKRAEPALYHARRCLELTRQHAIGGLDLAFAHEAMARACAIAHDEPEAAKQMELAREAAAKIEKQDDREYVEGELTTIPGWGD